MSALPNRYAHAGRRLAQRLWFYSAAPATTYRLAEPLLRWARRRTELGELDLARVKRVVVVRLDKLGDLVLSTAFLRELRRNLPHAWITLVVTPSVRAVVANCPYVDEVRTHDWRASRFLGPLHQMHTAAVTARDLLRHRYDLAIVPSWGVDYYLATFVAYFSGAVWRVGYSEHVTEAKQRLNRGFDRLFTHLSPDGGTKHEVEHNLDLIRFVGGVVEKDHLELWTGSEDDAFAARILAENRVHPGDLLIGIAPGAGAPKRRWPLHRFVALASWLCGHFGARIVVVGGPGEESLGRALHHAVGDRAIDLISRASVLQTAAVLKRCQLFIGNDSGPMHLAVAGGVQVVEMSCHSLRGSPLHENSPDRFGPWGAGHVILRPEDASPPCADACSAADAHCIERITLEEAKTAVAKCLSRFTGSSNANAVKDHGMDSAV